MAEKYQQRHEISTTTATIDEIAVFLSGSMSNPINVARVPACNVPQ